MEALGLRAIERMGARVKVTHYVSVVVKGTGSD